MDDVSGECLARCKLKTSWQDLEKGRPIFADTKVISMAHCTTLYACTCSLAVKRRLLGLSITRCRFCSYCWQLSLMEQERLTLPVHPSGICVAGSLVFCVVFYRSLFVLFSPFFCPLCCLSFFDLLILITPLVSSHSSWTYSPPESTLYIQVFATGRYTSNNQSIINK